jgi:hypothetical protein
MIAWGCLGAAYGVAAMLGLVPAIPGILTGGGVLNAMLAGASLTAPAGLCLGLAIGLVIGALAARTPVEPKEEDIPEVLPVEEEPLSMGAGRYVFH